MSEATDNVEATAEAPEATSETQTLLSGQDGSAEAVASDRPEWLPEKFKTAEDLVSSYSQLESKLGKSQEELRESLISELEQQAMAGVPESSGGYELPEDVPASMSDDALLRYAEFAHKNGFTQEEFVEGLNDISALIPMPNLDAEREKLGENANARIEAVALWAKNQFPEEFQGEILRLGQSADGVRLLESIMQNMSDSPVSNDTTAPARLSEADLRSMMSDPRYWNSNQRDPAFIKQVDEGFAKLYK
jgi:hypothetical protein